MMPSNNRQVVGFDILKFSLAIVIISLHSSLGAPFLPAPFNNWILNFQNLAVPGFFVISAYLFFSKIDVLSEENKINALLNYEKRILVLYLLWSVIMLPITLSIHDYLSQGWHGIIYFVKDFFLGYTFLASWFFGALLVAMPIVFLFRQLPYLLLFFALSLYLYFMLSDKLPLTLQTPLYWYSTNIASPRISFPEGLIWLIIGFLMYSIRMIDHQGNSKMLLWGGVIASIFVKELQIVGVVSLVTLSGMMQVSGRFEEIGIKLRKLSTLFYCIHFPIIHAVWKLIDPQLSFLVFIVSFVLTYLLSLILLFLSHIKSLSFLRLLM